MASKAVGDGSQRPSFAKVAAMKPPNNVKSAMNMQENKPPVAKAKTPNLPISSVSPGPLAEDVKSNDQVSNKLNDDIHVLNKRIENLNIEQATPPVSAHSPVSTSTEGASEADGILKTEGSMEDDQTQLSNSSTKPTSFDSKSMASVTTFAMDEKDSLRPDDSASVKAAEEEESFSGPASAAPSSRVGSEAGVRPFRDQFREISVQRNATAIAPGLSRFQDDSIQIPPGIPGQPISSHIAGTDAFQNGGNPLGFPSQPDEKLLEAMNTPKDRLFLLQLEQKIVAFIKESKDDILDLPPCNSFCRLLAHKLADYYHLTHFVDNNISAVRLYRTPVTRVPMSLSLLSIPPHAAGTPDPNAPRRQIMRRGDVGAGGSTAVSSSVPSKTTSEVGATSDEDPSRVMSPADPLTAKDKAALTREEREAKYKEVRERIFGPNDEASVPDTQLVGENSADMSRSSSSSGKKKPRKQRTPVDDTFQARSQYGVFYPGVPFVSGGQSNYPGTFPEQSYVSPYPLSPDPSMGISYMPNQSPGTQMFIPQNPVPNLQPYQMGTPVNYGQSDGWMNGTPMQWPPYVNFGQAPQIPSQQSSAKSSPAMNNYAQPTTPQFQHPNRSWAPSPYQSPYQPQPTHQPLPTRWPEFPSQPYGLGTPYQYGQLPSQPFNPGASPANQHPIPGSYTRPPFNPQSRAFVPSGGSPLRFHGAKAHSTTPVVGPTNSGHPFVPPEVSAQPQSNNQGQSLKTDSIAKWGRPAHLPPKPPPSEDPSAFDLSHQIAQNFGPGLLVAKSAAIGNPTGQQGLPRVQSPHSGY